MSPNQGTAPDQLEKLCSQGSLFGPHSRSPRKKDGGTQGKRLRFLESTMVERMDKESPLGIILASSLPEWDCQNRVQIAGFTARRVFPERSTSNSGCESIQLASLAPHKGGSEKLPRLFWAPNKQKAPTSFKMALGRAMSRTNTGRQPSLAMFGGNQGAGFDSTSIRAS